MGRDDIFKREHEGRKQRMEAIRYERETEWLIVCEGEKTEPNYFNGLVEYFNQNSSSQVAIRAVGQGRNTTDLVEHLEDYFAFMDRLLGRSLIPYEKVILVFDKDSFSSEQFNSAVYRAKKENPGCIVAWSNESFELWLLLHYDYIDSALSRYDYNQKLTKLFREKGICDKTQSYEKNWKSNIKLFDAIIKSGGSVERAVANAEKLIKDKDLSNPAKINPATMVCEAVKALADEAGYLIKRGE